jgi:TPR repeat protein
MDLALFCEDDLIQLDADPEKNKQYRKILQNKTLIICFLAVCKGRQTEPSYQKALDIIQWLAKGKNLPEANFYLAQVYALGKMPERHNDYNYNIMVVRNDLAAEYFYRAINSNRANQYQCDQELEKKYIMHFKYATLLVFLEFIVKSRAILNGAEGIVKIKNIFESDHAVNYKNAQIDTIEASICYHYPHILETIQKICANSWNKAKDKTFFGKLLHNRDPEDQSLYALLKDPQVWQPQRINFTYQRDEEIKFNCILPENTDTIISELNKKLSQQVSGTLFAKVTHVNELTQQPLTTTLPPSSANSEHEEYAHNFPDGEIDAEKAADFCAQVVSQDGYQGAALKLKELFQQYPAHPLVQWHYANSILRTGNPIFHEYALRLIIQAAFTGAIPAIQYIEDYIKNNSRSSFVESYASTITKSLVCYSKKLPTLTTDAEKEHMRRLLALRNKLNIGSWNDTISDMSKALVNFRQDVILNHRRLLNKQAMIEIILNQATDIWPTDDLSENSSMKKFIELYKYKTPGNDKELLDYITNELKRFFTLDNPTTIKFYIAVYFGDEACLYNIIKKTEQSNTLDQDSCAFIKECKNSDKYRVWKNQQGMKTIMETIDVILKTGTTYTYKQWDIIESKMLMILFKNKTGVFEPPMQEALTLIFGDMVFKRFSHTKVKASLDDKPAASTVVPSVLPATSTVVPPILPATELVPSATILSTKQKDAIITLECYLALTENGPSPEEKVQLTKIVENIKKNPTDIYFSFQLLREMKSTTPFPYLFAGIIGLAFHEKSSSVDFQTAVYFCRAMIASSKSKMPDYALEHFIKLDAPLAKLCAIGLQYGHHITKQIRENPSNINETDFQEAFIRLSKKYNNRLVTIGDQDNDHSLTTVDAAFYLGLIYDYGLHFPECHQDPEKAAECYAYAAFEKHRYSIYRLTQLFDTYRCASLVKWYYAEGVLNSAQYQDQAMRLRVEAAFKGASREATRFIQNEIKNSDPAILFVIKYINEIKTVLEERVKQPLPSHLTPTENERILQMLILDDTLKNIFSAVHKKYIMPDLHDAINSIKRNMSLHHSNLSRNRQLLSKPVKIMLILTLREDIWEEKALKDEDSALKAFELFFNANSENTKAIAKYTEDELNKFFTTKNPDTIKFLVAVHFDDEVLLNDLLRKPSDFVALADENSCSFLAACRYPDKKSALEKQDNMRPVMQIINQILAVEDLARSRRNHTLYPQDEFKKIAGWEKIEAHMLMLLLKNKTGEFDPVIIEAFQLIFGDDFLKRFPHVKVNESPVSTATLVTSSTATITGFFSDIFNTINSIIPPTTDASSIEQLHSLDDDGGARESRNSEASITLAHDETEERESKEDYLEQHEEKVLLSSSILQPSEDSMFNRSAISDVDYDLFHSFTASIGSGSRPALSNADDAEIIMDNKKSSAGNDKNTEAELDGFVLM